MSTYPDTPGWRRHDTSRAAAEAVESRAATLRAAVLKLLREYGSHTVHETAARLGENVPSVQPRFSELLNFRLITDSGLRRRNKSGVKAIVWRLTRDDEFEKVQPRLALLQRLLRTERENARLKKAIGEILRSTRERKTRTIALETLRRDDDENGDGRGSAYRGEGSPVGVGRSP